MKTLLTTEQVAQTLQINQLTVYALIARGELEASRIGKGYRISEEAVAAYIKRNTVRASEEEKAG